MYGFYLITRALNLGKIVSLSVMLLRRRYGFVELGALFLVPMWSDNLKGLAMVPVFLGDTETTTIGREKKIPLPCKNFWSGKGRLFVKTLWLIDQ
jgi:hypothetical protein